MQNVKNGDVELGFPAGVVKSDTWSDANPLSAERGRSSVGGGRLGVIKGEDIAAEMKFTSMADIVRNSDEDCISGGDEDERIPLTHAQLRLFLFDGFPKILTSVMGGTVSQRWIWQPRDVTPPCSTSQTTRTCVCDSSVFFVG